MRYIFTLYLGVILLISAVTATAQNTVPGQNFGYTNGAFSVSDAGAATYNIPLVLPPGTAGI